MADNTTQHNTADAFGDCFLITSVRQLHFEKSADTIGPQKDTLSAHFVTEKWEHEFVSTEKDFPIDSQSCLAQQHLHLSPISVSTMNC